MRKIFLVISSLVLALSLGACAMFLNEQEQKAHDACMKFGDTDLGYKIIKKFYELHVDGMALTLDHMCYDIVTGQTKDDMPAQIKNFFQ